MKKKGLERVEKILESNTDQLSLGEKAYKKLLDDLMALRDDFPVIPRVNYEKEEIKGTFSKTAKDMKKRLLFFRKNSEIDIFNKTRNDIIKAIIEQKGLVTHLQLLKNVIKKHPKNGEYKSLYGIIKYLNNTSSATENRVLAFREAFFEIVDSMDTGGLCLESLFYFYTIFPKYFKDLNNKYGKLGPKIESVPNDSAYYKDIQTTKMPIYRKRLTMLELVKDLKTPANKILVARRKFNTKPSFSFTMITKELVDKMNLAIARDNGGLIQINDDGMLAQDLLFILKNIVAALADTPVLHKIFDKYMLLFLCNSQVKKHIEFKEAWITRKQKCSFAIAKYLKGQTKVLILKGGDSKEKKEPEETEDG
jgi:hypothetical protein